MTAFGRVPPFCMPSCSWIPLCNKRLAFMSTREEAYSPLTTAFSYSSSDGTYYRPMVV
jgi:hypothetical protein